MKIAYFINQYPKVSHSFIRREIQALERQGVSIQRFALRGWTDELADRRDVEERKKTRYVLAGGLWSLVAALVQVGARRPVYFARALSGALRMGWRSRPGIARHLAYLAEACVLLGWCEAGQIQHLHAHFGTNSASVAALLRLLDGPSFSFTVHGEEGHSVAGLSIDEKVGYAAFVVAVSSFGRGQLSRHVAHAQWGKIEVVHCGLDDSFYRGTSPDVVIAPRLVCVGRLCAEKAQLLLIEAVARLAHEGVPIQLVLAGDGELRSEIERLVGEKGLAGAVSITGWVDGDRVREEILAARALVLPSFAEGLPIVIMEAMALGRPVISTYVGGIPELVVPGETGWLVPTGDVKALGAAMREVLEADPEMLRARGLRGRKRVLERHDIDVAAAKLLGLFQRALGVEAAGGCSVVASSGVAAGISQTDG